MPSPHFRKLIKWSAIVLTVLGILFGAMYGQYRDTFPHGSSHPLQDFQFTQSHERRVAFPQLGRVALAAYGR